MGDLNAAIGSPALRPIEDALTNVAPTGDHVPSAERPIDHIFWRPGREDQQVIVEDVLLVGEVVDRVHPIGQRAVLAILRWH